jgi:hypothetical protein
VTYDPGRRGGGRVPVLRSEWREPLRAQRDPLAADEGRIRASRDGRQRWRKRTWLGRFISTYGWRAYALPVLTAVTVLAIVQVVNGTSKTGSTLKDGGPVPGAPTFDPVGTAIIGAPPRGLTQFDANIPTGVLPDGGPYTEAGAKTWHIVPGAQPQVGQGSRKVFSYTIEIEDGIDVSSFGGDDAFARLVSQTLGNEKNGWTHNQQFAFRHIDGGKPDFRISLTSPMTLREGCGYEIQLEASCYNPAYGPEAMPRVLINEARWVRGAMPFQGDIVSYRQYVINHEVGHAMGYRQHEPCPENGALAPVMMQQTFTTGNNDEARFDPETVKPDGLTCKPNPWPYPIA